MSPTFYVYSFFYTYPDVPSEICPLVFYIIQLLVLSSFF